MSSPICPTPQISEASRPKLMFFGDPHGHFDGVVAAVRARRPRAIVLLGDLQPRRPLHVELEPILGLTDVWFIHGNHDTDSDADYDNLFGSELADRSLHGRVVEIHGLRVAGLGGVFRGSIWAPPAAPNVRTVAERIRSTPVKARWRGGLPRRHWSSIFPEDYERLMRERADVLVTHEAPSHHPHGSQAVDDLAKAMRVRLLVHGHLHEHIDYGDEGRLPIGCPYDARGVRPDFPLVWPVVYG